jgi:hypothetical protein
LPETPRLSRPIRQEQEIGAPAGTPDKLPVLLGNSGVGKFSLAQAGVLRSTRVKS